MTRLHIGRAPLAGLVLFAAALTAAAQDAPKDYTKVDPKELGITPVSPAKDAKTGFIVGGKNPTSVIRKLTEINGVPITSLEKVMRPGQLSRLGFIGKDERLLDVLAADNEFVVEKLGLTHQELARHLHIAGAIGHKHAATEPVTFAYHGRQYKIKAELTRGMQESPFEDETKTNCTVTLTNRTNGKQLKYSLLVPHMVERYGFYEGHGTPYRVEPQAILDVFDFVAPAKGS